MSNVSFSSGYGEYSSGELQSKSFELTSNNIPLFSRKFASNLDTVVDLDADCFIFSKHNFVTGEELFYSYNNSLSNKPIGIGTTVISGVSTDILPSTLYAVRVNSSKISVSASKTESLLENPKILDLTSYGEGFHKISTKNPNLNTLITINNVIQNPIVSTSITTHITQNLNSLDLIISIDDTSKIKGGDYLKIDEEILKVLVVDESTKDIIVNRGIFGTQITEHLESTEIKKIEGNYNIIDNFIYFEESPYGNIESPSTFSGRVFLRSGIENSSIGPYDRNYIIDYLSDKFTGITSTFTLKNQGNNITGISTDNVIITVNDIFQSPSRLSGNIINGNYILSENVGITSITFSGVGVTETYDVNLTGYPRGGVILSVGSSQGFGYQPLISAGGTAIVSSAGTIQSISIGYSGSGYRAGIQTVFVGVSTGTSVEVVGIASVVSGSISSINIINPGTGYTFTNPPEVVFDYPFSYNNIPLIYSNNSPGNKKGFGATIDVVVGQGSSIIDFTIRNFGYNYQEGDLLTIPIGGATGIPTSISSGFEEFNILVDNVYYDSSFIRSIGELVIFDPMDELFDGSRTIFPLKINGEQISILSKVGSTLDVQNNLLIFIDNVLQVPGEAYTFNGGSLLTFTEPPRSESTSTILFYAGTDNIDTQFVEILPTIQIGDEVQIIKQNQRTVYDIISSDAIKTNLYQNQEISNTNEIRPLTWCPQNVDKLVTGVALTTSLYATKDRIIYEPLIHPTAYLIKNTISTDTSLYVDNLKTFFDNSSESPIRNDILIISQEIKIPAVLSATISSGEVSNVEIINPGAGFSTSPSIVVSSPTGIGTTAVLVSSINASGGISTVTIVNPGAGYTSAPLLLVDTPKEKTQLIPNVTFEGDFGIVAGVGTTTYDGSQSFMFNLFIPLDSYLRNSSVSNNTSGVSGISTGDYFVISNSNIGTPTTSLTSIGNTIGIGTTFIDNVYQVATYSIKQKPVYGIGTTSVNEIIVKVSNNTSLSGIAASGYYGEYSWGKISGITSSILKDFVSYAPGITTSAIIQRNNPLKYSNYLI